MRRFLILLSSAAALAGASVEVASARDGCGRGLYWDGYGCAPQRRAYVPPPAYGYGAYGSGYRQEGQEGRRRHGGDPRCPGGGVYGWRPGTGQGCY